MKIPQQVGGLAVAAHSHQRGLREHVEDSTAQSYVLKGRRQKGIPVESVDEPWLTAQYEPSDVLIFHSHTIHRALPNRSRLVRLSIDARAQPAARLPPPQATQTMLEQRDYRSRVETLADAERADRGEFEAILLKMVRNGDKADSAVVRQRLSELRASNAVSSRR